MFNSLFRDKRVLARLRSSCLGKTLVELVGDLQRRGYALATIKLHVCGAEHFGRWLKSRRIKLRQVTDREASQFVHDHLPRCSCEPPVLREVRIVHASLRHLLKILSCHYKRVGVVSPIDLAMKAFDSHLADVCGLAENTRRCHGDFVRQFLQGKFGRSPIQPARITMIDLTRFITASAGRWKPRTIRAACSGLRHYLRFLQLNGFDVQNLIGAIPRIPVWRLADIPQTLTVEELQKLFNSCDRSTAAGCRDYAIMHCMADLGLRSEEVARLTMDDVDWRESTLRVFSGKVGRARQLPLPDRVGRAIAEYLRQHRPEGPTRHLFLRHRYLVGRSISPMSVRHMVRQASKLADLRAGGFGPHTLRRTFATKMVQHGVSLKQVADLLGHRSIDTTVIYTKVNLPLLSGVAMPWPEVHP